MNPRTPSLFMIICLSVSFSGCGREAPPPPAAKAAPPPPEVERVAAVRKTIALQQQVPGRLQAVRTADIRARVEGIVEQQVFTEGTEVKAGAVLYRLEARTLAAQVKSAQAALDSATAERLLARQLVERAKTLVHTKAVSQQDFDQADARHKKAVAEVMTAEAALSRARINLEYATITTPIDGRVGRSRVTEGALVGQKESTHLTTVEQLDPIRVHFTQSSPEWFRLQRTIRQGGAQPITPVTVQLLLDDDVRYPLTGQLHFTDMAVDPQTGAVALRAEFPNPDKVLLPGQFVRVQLAMANIDGITVPQRAVQTSPQGQVVLMVDEQNKVVPRPVQSGGFSGQEWIITTGLQEGEKVIVNGLQKARPGTVVTPRDVPPVAPATRSDGAAAPASPTRTP
ncbi:MAG: efflux RND transporter periplasmic adaptor subunit [Magnetococcus sp. DMHC-8]